MRENHLEIFDLSERDREYLLLDDKECVLWISYELRRKIASAGFPSSQFLGLRIDAIKNHLPATNPNLRRTFSDLCNGLSEVRLFGQCLLKAERKNKTDRAPH